MVIGPRKKPRCRKGVLEAGKEPFADYWPYSGTCWLDRGHEGECDTAYQRVTHRIRRGKVVEIPEVWRGHTLHKQTKHKRNTVSRRTRKNKNKST